MEQLKDMEIVCIDCGFAFEFSRGEQEFLNTLFQKGEVKEIIPPKRCMECRSRRKASYANYNKLHNKNT